MTEQNEADTKTEIDIGAENEAADKSMDDTIREEYRRLTANAAEGSDDETPDEKPARTRGPDGKFARQAASDAEQPAASDLSQATAAPEAAAPVADYPNTWKKEFQSEWSKLAPSVKAEIKRREQNFLDGVRQYQEPAAFGRAIGQEMLPHVEVMRRVGVTPQQLTRDMMGVWTTLVGGTPAQKSQALLNMAQQYGIDIAAPNALTSTGSDAAPAISPDLAPVLQRVQGIEQLVRQQAAQAAHAASQQATNEVRQFASRADRQHFAAVQETMAQLIGSGQAETLDDAYDKAVWLVPEVREKLLAEQAEKRSHVE